MGCKAITPHLVGLAKRLEGKPFHLVAAHNQRDTKENVVSYIQGQGLAADTPNVTVTSFGRHPKVKGNGYVPYYMVFDQHGDLAHHHMCGAYHGGDGLKMIEWVDKLLKDVDAVYLGKEPFARFDKLARQVGKKKSLPAAINQIERALAGEVDREERAELERLKSAIVDYRDRMLARAEELYAADPTRVEKHLADLAKDVKGTPLAEPVDTKLAEARKSADLRAAVALYKKYEKAMRRLEKQPTPKNRQKTAEKLEKLLEGHDSLPVAATIRATIAELKGG